LHSVTFIKVDSSHTIELQAISKKTFHDAFAWGNVPEVLDNYIESAFKIENLEAELANKNSQFYFAKIDNETVGYFKINVGSAQTEDLDPNALELQRIYILENHQGKKIGNAILAEVEQLATEQNIKSIWLGVWDRNEKAIAFYEKNGYVKIDSHTFMMGDEEQIDFIMQKQI
jgi:diamine N-acetyltransferase